MHTTGIPNLRFGAFLLIIFAVAVVSAQAKAPDEPPAHPATSTIFGNTGVWKVLGADNVPPKNASFSVWYDRINRNPGFLTISTVGISGAVGITDWLEFGMNFEINRHILARRQDQLSFGQQRLGLFGNRTRGAAPLPTELVPGTIFPQLRFPAAPSGAFNGTAGYYNNLPWIGSELGSNGVGTVGFGLKLNALSENWGDPVGLAFRAYGVIPTHRSVAFLLAHPVQTGEWQEGADVILSKSIADMAEVHFNAGFRGIQSPGNGRQIVLSDEVPLGFALVAPRKTRLQLIAEVTADIFVSAHTASTTFDTRDPVDGTIGFRAFVTKSLAIGAGYRHTLNQFGGDKNGFIADVTFTTPRPTKAPPAPPSLTCSADPSQVNAGETVNLSAQGISSTGSPLTYEWSTSGGTIEGTGATVKWNTTTLAPGDYTATVRATEEAGIFAECSVRATVKTPPPPPQPPTVKLSADKTRPQVGEIVNLTADARSPDNRPLAYGWSSSGGRVEGSGARTRFDTTGLQPGPYTVRVKVTDDRNLSAEDSLDLAVVAPPPPPPPPPPPQPSKLNECDFRLNSARVDNVCKAKLDDVALRLRNEPESTIVVLGFAQTRERNGDRLADSRANNVKQYLVRDKGIAENRVQAGRGAPGAGKAEIHLVPRGASFTAGEVVAPAPARPTGRTQPVRWETQTP